VNLKPNPVFLCKEFDYSTGKRNFEGFNIEGMKHRLGPGLEEDALLCPVRALRWYLDRTKHLRGNKTRLFISYKAGHKTDICLNTISSWIKETVKMAYKDCPEGTMKILKVSAHEVRALAASTAFYGNIALSEVLKAARWTNQTTFTSFYLRDVSVDLEGLSSLGPIMVAQQVV
jgi:hypothetical protein